MGLRTSVDQALQYIQRKTMLHAAMFAQSIQTAPTAAQTKPFSPSSSMRASTTNVLPLSPLSIASPPVMNLIIEPPMQLPETIILRHYLLTQYLNFEILEQYLHRPRYLNRQLLFPLDPDTKQYLIEKYYTFDERVIREIMGKKLNSRSRKELDDVADKARVPIGACRRMFDNLKRIVKKVEDAEGNMLKIIQMEFCLNPDLARFVAAAFFMGI